VCKARLMTNPKGCSAWSNLDQLAKKVPSIKELIGEPNPGLRVQAAGVNADFSRQRISSEVLKELFALVDQTGVLELRDAMFNGKAINESEERGVLHTALRLPADSMLNIDGENIVGEVQAVLSHMSHFAESVRSGKWKGVTGKPINRVVNIGIGGSSLGPETAYEALRAFAHEGIDFAFVSNVDPADIETALQDSDPERTLFIIVSKTFTTAETMANADAAKSWLLSSLNNFSSDQVIPQHFVAVSTNEQAVREFGIDARNMFGFWDWVGGRYSLSSAVGLSTMIAIGPENFARMLSGFNAMDVHFLTAPLEVNLPVIMGCVAVWNRNFLNIDTTAVLPYSQYLCKFPAYLQQLTMESNGKQVRKDGTPVTYNTGGIYWGERGTNGQHSFYQLLHQGTSLVASDIVIVAREASGSHIQQEMLVANALAQAAVLSIGVTAEELIAQGTPFNLVPHKVMPGNRPVTILMIGSLDPFSLGSLIALYEHSVFVQGAIWGINSFDQWGVEMGKKVATGIANSFSNPVLRNKFDLSTQASIEEFLKLRSGN
jgi:glucose-6-phosphate isomerase